MNAKGKFQGICLGGPLHGQQVSHSAERFEYELHDFTIEGIQCSAWVLAEITDEREVKKLILDAVFGDGTP